MAEQGLLSSRVKRSDALTRSNFSFARQSGGTGVASSVRDRSSLLFATKK